MYRKILMGSFGDIQFYIAFILTGSYFLIELVFGIITNSLALKADAFHMLSDLIAIIIAFGTNKISKKKKSSYATYGWVRTEILGGVINSVFLLSSCLTIFIEVVQRFFYIDEVKDTMDKEIDKLLIVAVIGLLINIINFGIFQISSCLGIEGASHGHSHAIEGGGHGHSHHGEGGSNSKKKRNQNMNIRAMMMHIFGDILGSIGVIITALTIKFVPYDWVYYVDPLCSLFIITIIIIGTSPVLIKCVRILSQNSSKKIDMLALQKDLMRIPTVIDIHEFHVWRLNPSTNIATIHIYTDQIDKVEQTLTTIKTLLHSYGIHSTTIQPEFEPKCNEPICMDNCLESRCCTLPLSDITEVEEEVSDHDHSHGHGHGHSHDHIHGQDEVV